MGDCASGSCDFRVKVDVRKVERSVDEARYAALWREVMLPKMLKETKKNE